MARSRAGLLRSFQRGKETLELAAKPGLSAMSPDCTPTPRSPGTMPIQDGEAVPLAIRSDNIGYVALQGMRRAHREPATDVPGQPLAMMLIAPARLEAIRDPSILDRRSTDRWAQERNPGTMPIQDGTNQTAFVAATHLGWEAARRRPQAQVRAARRIARVPATPVEAPSCPRDLAHAAARVEPSQPPQLPPALGGIRRSLQSRWLPADPLLRARKSPPPDRGGGRCGASLARSAGTRGADRAPSQPADGSDREGIRGPLPPTCPAFTGRSRAGGRIRAGQLRRARASARGARLGASTGRVQLRRATRDRTTAGCAGAKLAIAGRLAARLHSSGRR